MSKTDDKKKEQKATVVSALIKKQETASASANTALTRAGVKTDPKKAHKQCAYGFTGRFTEARESGASPQGKRFRVTMLQEGLGNLKDCYFYTKPAISSAVSVFEGQHFFINHPKQSEEVDRPERDINDLTGYFENVAAEIKEDGRAELCGDLVLVTGAAAFDRYRALIMESLSYAMRHPDKDLVGLSINAGGDNAESPLDLFMQEYEVPESCKEKLLEAQSKGISTIRPVTAIKSAISCDLVTAAGAGGKVKQLLEENKMAKQEETKQEETKQEETKQEEKKEETAEHPDEQQDVELIKKMLAKYVGDGFTDEDHKQAGAALKHAEDMGMKGEEAMKCAGHYMKMAKHIQSKQESEEKAKQAECGKQEEVKQEEAKQEKGEPAGVTPPAQAPKDSQKQESDKMVLMAGEIAGLKRELDTMKLEKHVDKALRESKLPMTATKKFRECLTDIRTTKEVDDKLKLFKEAYFLGGEAEETSFVLGAEKTDANLSEAGLSFADCAK